MPVRKENASYSVDFPMNVMFTVKLNFFWKKTSDTKYLLELCTLLSMWNILKEFINH